MKPLFKTHEVAEVFGVTVWTVLRWVKDGKLRAVRIGNSYRIRATEVERFVNAGEKVEA